MDDIWKEIYRLLGSGGDVVVATIVAHRGSTPRTSGAKMIVSRDGTLTGTIGGGPVEAEVVERAQSVFAEKKAILVAYNFTTSNSAAAMDLICGGRFEVLVEYLEADQETRQMVAAIRGAVAEGKKTMRLCRLIESPESEVVDLEHGVMSGDNTWLGTLQPGEGLQDTIVAKKRGLQATTLLEYDGERYLLELIMPKETVYILGGGHVAREIAPLLHRASFQTVVMDDRAEFASSARFPEADRLVVCSGYSQVFADFVPAANSYIIIVTRGHSYDKECLGQALRTNASYIGMIGSRQKREQIYRLLRQEGISADALARVHCPIGLAIGGETPFEIAVSIVAEIIGHRAQQRIDP